jgi:hypothetical protein
MKKITVLVILILVAASFLLYLNRIGNAQDNVSFTVQPDNVAFSAPEPTGDQENSSQGTTVQQQDDSTGTSDDDQSPEPTKAVYSDVSYYYDGNTMAIKGVVSDLLTGDPVQGLTVVEFCNDKVINDNADVTAADGSFDFDVSGKCANGQEHKVMVEYEGIQSFTDNVVLMRKPVKRVSGGSSILSAAPSTGVPEFSTLTLAIVILGGSLGLAILRKD